MNISATASNEKLNWMPVAISLAVSHTLYDIACKIFRVIAMALQYAVVISSITLRHCRLLPSALPFKFLKMSSRNIASFYVLHKCLATAWTPLSKSLYSSIGYAQDLRITHDITYRPASGLCLAMSLTFLSEYLGTDKDSFTDSLLAAAKVVQGGGTKICVKTQALYDALLGIQGTVASKEFKEFNKLLQGENPSCQDLQNKALWTSVETFLSDQNRTEPLRQFVFEDLEKQHAEITPNIYALVLELDAAWFSKMNPGKRKYDFVHEAVTEAVVNSRELEVISTSRIEGKIPLVSGQLINLADGSYLIQFSDHTVALVKEHDGLALFDPSEGIALLTPDQQSEALLQLLDYYGNNDSVSIKVILIQECDSRDNSFVEGRD